jgi:hypothetical protein
MSDYVIAVAKYALELLTNFFLSSRRDRLTLNILDNLEVKGFLRNDKMRAYGVK